MTDILNVTNHLAKPMTRPHGYVETLDAEFATGWALHASNEPALVRAFSGTVLAGEALANSPRPDVDAAAYGRPGGGFRLRLAHSLSAEEQDGLVLLAGDQPLPRLPALNLTRRAFPVFIVGSPRSGTSILALALRRAGYTGFFEGNLLSMLVQLHQDVDRHYRDYGTTSELVLTAHIDPGQLKARLSAVLRDAVEPLYAGRPWMDKTGNPEMIAAIPVLRELWPDSVFIFAKRRAIENVVSRLRKFPHFDFAYHCRDWARNMSIWRQLRAAYPSLPVLEVDQHDIAAAPGMTAGAIGSFLRLPPACISIMTQAFAEVRTEETQPGTATRTLTMTAAGWSEAEQQEFRALCGAEMAAFNYTEGETYNGA